MYLMYVYITAKIKDSSKEPVKTIFEPIYEPDAIKTTNKDGPDASKLDIYAFCEFPVVELTSSNSLICIIGKRGSGKTYLCEDLLNQMKSKFSGGGILISHSVQATDSSIYNHYDPNILNDFMNEKSDRRRFIILDDCLNKSNYSDDILKSLIYNHRHRNITVFLIVQEMPAFIRPLVDYIFILKGLRSTTLKAIYNYTNSITFTDFQLFRSLINKFTENNYGCMVINNRIQTDELTNAVYPYKARKHQMNIVDMCTQN